MLWWVGLAGENKVPREVKVGNFIRGSSPTIPGKIEDKTPAVTTIDTGADSPNNKSRTIICKKWQNFISCKIECFLHLENENEID